MEGVADRTGCLWWPVVFSGKRRFSDSGRINETENTYTWDTASHMMNFRRSKAIGLYFKAGWKFGGNGAINGCDPDREKPVLGKSEWSYSEHEEICCGELFEPDLTPVANENRKSKPGAEISQTFSNTDVRVVYHRPAPKDREVFGKLVPYGKVWRCWRTMQQPYPSSRNVIIDGRDFKRSAACLLFRRNKTRHFNKMLNQ